MKLRNVLIIRALLKIDATSDQTVYHTGHACTLFNSSKRAEGPFFTLRN